MNNKTCWKLISNINCIRPKKIWENYECHLCKILVTNLKDQLIKNFSENLYNKWCKDIESNILELTKQND